MIREATSVVIALLIAFSLVPSGTLAAPQAEYLMDMYSETPFILQVTIPANATVVATCNGSPAGFFNNGSSLIYISTSKNISESFLFSYAFSFANETSGTISFSLNENRFTIPFENTTSFAVKMNVTTVYYLTPLDLQTLLQTLLIPLQNSTNSSSQAILDKIEQMYLVVNSTNQNTNTILNDTAVIKQQVWDLRNQIIDHITNQIALLRQADDEFRNRLDSINASVVALNTKLNDGFNSLNSNIASVGGIASTISNYAVSTSGNVLWTMYSAFAILGVSFVTLILSIRRRGEPASTGVYSGSMEPESDAESYEEIPVPAFRQAPSKKGLLSGVREPRREYAVKPAQKPAPVQVQEPEPTPKLLKRPDLPTNIAEVLGEAGAPVEQPKPQPHPTVESPFPATKSAMKVMGVAKPSPAQNGVVKPFNNGIIQKPAIGNGLITKPDFGDAQ